MSNSIFTTLIAASPENMDLIAMQHNENGSILVGLEEDGEWFTLCQTVRPMNDGETAMGLAQQLMAEAKASLA
jgi:hypothetical protein